MAIPVFPFEDMRMRHVILIDLQKGICDTPIGRKIGIGDEIVLRLGLRNDAEHGIIQMCEKWKAEGLYRRRSSGSCL
jgi:hypothetical protein